MTESNRMSGTSRWRRMMVLAAATIALASCSSSESTSESALELQALGGVVHGRLIDASDGNPVADVAGMQAVMGMLVERNVMGAGYGYAYEDADGDGLVDGGELELTNGTDVVCVDLLAERDEQPRLGSCNFTNPVKVTASSTTRPGDESPTTVVPDVVPTSSRPRPPGGLGAVTDAADELATVQEATSFEREVRALAAFDQLPPATVSLIETVRPELRNGAELFYADSDGDGVADGNQVTYRTGVGLAACVTFQDTYNKAATVTYGSC